MPKRRRQPSEQPEQPEYNPTPFSLQQFAFQPFYFPAQVPTGLSLQQLLADPDDDEGLPPTQPPPADQVAAILEVLEELLAQRSPTIEATIGPVDVMLRRSIVPRRRPSPILDFDVVQISVRKAWRRKGVGTAFFHDLMRAAWVLGRGAYLEVAFTPSSRALAARMVNMGLVTPALDPDCYLSVVPPPP